MVHKKADPPMLNTPLRAYHYIASLEQNRPMRERWSLDGRSMMSARRLDQIKGTGKGSRAALCGLAIGLAIDDGALRFKRLVC